jgi:hypothetical protein
MNNTDQFNTDFLFTTPSYLTGAATAFNLAGNFYEFNESETGNDADCKAIGNDFNIVGNDLREAFKSIMDNK